MSGFQRSVNTDPAPAVEGDFASANPRSSMLAGPGQLVAGALGVIVGRFAWARNSDGLVFNAHPGVVSRLGFVHRDQPSVITEWLGEATMTVPSGLGITLFDMGDFWARFAAGATIGQKVFVTYGTGLAVAGTAGSPPTATGVTVSMNNSTTVTAVAGGTLVPGQPVSGTGIPAGAYVVSVNAGAATAVLSAATTGGAATGVAVTQTTAKESIFYVHSTAAATELAKISDRPVTV